MQTNIALDVSCRQVDCAGERICGDVFLARTVALGGRSLLVLSDGMGHGVKANVLASLTASMLQNFMSAREDLRAVSEMMLKTLPVCSVRKTSYSTFTFLDIDHTSGTVTIVEYDNPHCLVFREGRLLPLEWQSMRSVRSDGREQTIRSVTFTACAADRLIVVSDGVTQSGQRTEKYRFGWGGEALAQFVEYALAGNREINAADLAALVVSQAARNDDNRPSDDMSCLAVAVRAPRRMLLVSCPPSGRDEYRMLADKVRDFDGRKVICGYPVAEILARELNLSVMRDDISVNPDVPPMWSIPTIDLVTEGIVTLNKTLEQLEYGAAPDETSPDADAVTQLCRLLWRCDEIEFLLGTRRQHDVDRYIPDEYELRRRVIRRIARLLETRLGKHVVVSYI